MAWDFRLATACCAIVFAFGVVPSAADTGAPMATTIDVDILPDLFVSNEFAFGFSAVPEPLLDIEATFKVYRHQLETFFGGALIRLGR